MRNTAIIAVALAIVVLVVAACAKQPTPTAKATSSPTPTVTPTLTQTSAAKPAPSLTATSTPGPTLASTTRPSPSPAVAPTTQAPTLASTPTPSASPAPLFLTVNEPADESIVEVSTITIRGQTLASAVVSINGESVDVGTNGNFSSQVTLDEGPNIFDIIATDDDGNEIATQLVVSFAP